MAKLSMTALNNLYKAYYAATEKLRSIGEPGYADRLHEDFGQELSAWDAWYGDGEDSDQIPDYRPTMADLNRELKKYGYKAIGGKSPRVVKL